MYELLLHTAQKGAVLTVLYTATMTRRHGVDMARLPVDITMAPAC